MDSSFKFIRFHICNTKTPTSNFKVKFMIHSSDNINDLIISFSIFLAFYPFFL
ncbi:conserved hypothetical protein (plasmid) [Borreliella valaisiana VS116]|uniref:Uncharacterized protein n=1 Tax=Borreliella valaisiana VS116 TaxID=445987 RepID=C0R8M5_BORVA|nr:conserved hypothetical protein [Borreliella valaisiana VS116]